MMSKSVKFFTVGCKVNQYETQAIREALLKKGYKESSREGKPDVFIINTCTVTAKADRDSRRFIHLSQKTNPDGKIVVTGCFTEKDASHIRAIPGVTHVIENAQKHTIPETLEDKDIGPRTKHFSPLEISGFKNHSRAFVKIQDGCNNFCSYCKVPYVRGRSRSRDEKSIVQEVSRLIQNGFKEVVLCGVCMGEWGKDISGNPELSDLIDKVDSIKGDFRLRLSSIEPNHVTQRLIEKIHSSSRISNHLHIPLQSGDDRILKLMMRPYSARDYMNLVGRIRKLISGFSLTTDVLVGFPGEGRRNFSNTVRVLKKVRPSNLHVFPYSRREGTKAYNLTQDISSDEIKRRTKALLDLGAELSYKYRKQFLNKTVRVLVEKNETHPGKPLAGYSDTYIRLFISGPDSIRGQLVSARITNLDKKSTFCVVLPSYP